VHLYGHPFDVDAINGVPRNTSLPVWRTRRRLTERSTKASWWERWRDSCFSFYPAKNLGAFGEGGALVTNDDDSPRTPRAARTRFACALSSRRGRVQLRMEDFRAPCWA